MGRLQDRAGGHGRGLSGTPPNGGGPGATTFVEAGRGPGLADGIVNPPVWRASTVLFDSLAALDAGMRDPDAGLYYGRRGTPTTWALEQALTALEPGAAGTKLYPSGVAAIAAALMTVVKAGDHVLIVDSAYEPTRLLANSLLKRLGVTASYYDPLIGAGIADLITEATSAIVLESPGSLSFEVQDVPAIVAAARARGVATIMDNTWATPVNFSPVAHGVDFSMQAVTKYVAGHSDVMMGAVTTTEAWLPRLKSTSYRLGYCVSPDDAYLALRGLRTLGVRMARHAASALEIARWLAGHPLVDRVLHPALPGCPGHASFVRDFRGASGLFGFVLRQGKRADTAALIDDLAHFGIGFSWGGFESLILPANVAAMRTATRFEAPGPLIRLSIGLEDPADLVADLDAGLARYGAQF